jgi:hypothetical protein
VGRTAEEDERQRGCNIQSALVTGRLQRADGSDKSKSSPWTASHAHAATYDDLEKRQHLHATVWRHSPMFSLERRHHQHHLAHSWVSTLVSTLHRQEMLLTRLIGQQT